MTYFSQDKNYQFAKIVKIIAYMPEATESSLVIQGNSIPCGTNIRMWTSAWTNVAGALLFCRQVTFNSGQRQPELCGRMGQAGLVL